ncbi:hypothetical protein BDQ17DRAFT_1321372 [Cyathus striatus]|nr:hypothetical protein BDQ17DRAFT_1321372 [Cyathus striatus]
MGPVWRTRMVWINHLYCQIYVHLTNPYYSQCLPGSAPSSSNGGSTSASTTHTTTVSTTPTTTVSGPTPSGSQIRTVQDPVYHFYLQNTGGTPVLGPESSSGYFTISGSISLTISNGTKLYLNIDSSGSASYKPLVFGTTATTTNWGLEGDTIITTNPRQLNFLACASSVSTIFNVYIQTGNDTPAGNGCTSVTMHLPCLC